VLNLLQPFNRARESRKKQKIEELINEIERMLYDFYPHEQVQAIVTEFKRRFNATTDYTALHTTLDNYRISLVDRALGRPTWSNTHTKLDP
jgi:translation initiation factor 2B subunit (eIF-2B alpha/beta/delta family)